MSRDFFVRMTVWLMILILSSLISLFANYPPFHSKLDVFLKKDLAELGLFHILGVDDFEVQAKQIVDKDLDDVIFDVALFGDSQEIRKLGITVHATFSQFVTARINLSQLHNLILSDEIYRIEKGGTFDLLLDKSIPSIHADLVHKGQINNTSLTGKGVIIGVIDSGIDIFHPDFHIPGNVPTTRILSLWDQTLTPIDGEKPPSGFTRGVEYSRMQIEDEIRGVTSGHIRSRDTHGHGTHVAGIAAGNGSLSDGLYSGVAPDTELIIVRVPAQRIDEIWIVDGMHYIFNKAQELGRPAVINLSLGGHSGAHDGTSLSEIVINELTKFEGQIVVVAAGNSGAPPYIHFGGEISVGETTEFTITVPEYNNVVYDTNRIVSMLWYDGAVAAVFRVQSPNGFFTSTTRSDSINSPDGKIVITSGGPNLKDARFYLLEIKDGDNSTHPQSGDWLIRFQPAAGIGPVRFNNWVVTSSMGNVTVSPHTERRYTLTIPGTAERAITVGSYITKNEWYDKNGTLRQQNTTLEALSEFSSGGPTRDARLKPDITAPGQLVVSAMSSGANIQEQVRVMEDGYFVNAGTSMATPHVTGVVALLLEANPRLMPEDILDIFARTGRGDNFATNLPNYDWGYGKIDAAAAVSIASEYLTLPADYVLSQNYPNPFNTGTRFYYRLPLDSDVNIVVYDVLGRKIKVLVDEFKLAGTHFGNFAPENLSTGVYFLHMRAGTFVETKKMLYLR